MKKALFLINAVTGRPAGKTIKESIVSELKGVLARDHYDTVFTEANIVGQIRNIAHDYETVVVVGGDGTMHQVVQGIVGLKNKPKAGIIPTGTGNDLARSLGILSFFKSHGLHALLELILDFFGPGDRIHELIRLLLYSNSQIKILTQQGTRFCCGGLGQHAGPLICGRNDIHLVHQ